MNRPRTKIVVLSTLILIISLLLASVALAGPGGGASPERAQLPITPQVRYPGIYITGLYATSGGVAVFPLLDEETLGADGDLLTVNWGEVEPTTPGEYNWQYIDTALAWAGSRSKLISILLNTYGSGHGVVGALPAYLWDPQNPNYVPNAVVYTGFDGCENDYDNPRCVFPRYWSDEYLQAYKDFLKAMGQRYNNDPRMEFIAIGIGRDGENYPVHYGDQELKNKFFEEIERDLATKDLFCEPDCNDALSVWIAVVKKFIDFYHEAFPNKVIYVQLAGSVFPFYERSIEKQQILDYAQHLNETKGAAIGQSVNNMYPNWNWAYMPRRTGFFDHLPAHGYDYAHGGAIKGNPDHSYPVAMEGYQKWIGCEGEIQVYWALLNALSKHPEYLRIYNTVLVEWNDEENQTGGPNWNKPRTEIVRLFRKWKKYLGRSPQTAPSAWIALREHKGPWYTCQGYGDPNQRTNTGYPDWGDYSYWIYHDFTKTGGKTVPETAFPAIYSWDGPVAAVDFMGDPYSPYFNDDPYNPDLPRRKETWALRRTDESTGNPYMFFDVDDQYIGPSNPADVVTITVTYVDMGTDTFSLHYQSASGGWRGSKAPLYAMYEVLPDDTLRPISVTVGITDVPKENTKQIRQAVFVVTDADFRNGIREYSDFYIDSNNDGDEWVHMVDVTKGDVPVAPTPTPWPTPTPTVTPTPLPSPSPTPTPTPTTATIRGKVYFDLNKNGVFDSGEPGVAGATLRLLYSGQLAQTLTTDATGEFAFTGLAPGFYVLSEQDPQGYQSTTTNQYSGFLTAGMVVEWNFGDYTNRTYVPIVHTP